MNGSLVEQLLADIIKFQMKLNDEKVWIRSQGRIIPTSEGVFIVVGMVDAPTVYSSQSNLTFKTIDAVEVPFEIQRVQLRENIQIDIFSRNTDSLYQRYQILHALTSINSKQVQEQYNFKIAQLPTSFVNTSDAEGGSNLNRFSIVVPCLTWHLNEINLSDYSNQYYDDFDTRVDDEKTIGTAQGIIEFNIKAED